MSGNKGKRKLKVIEISGNPYETGFQYGAACPEIRTMLDIIRQVFGGRDAVRELAEEYIPMYLPAAEAYAPEIVDEMKGMAAGAQLDFQDIFFIFNIPYPNTFSMCDNDLKRVIIMRTVSILEFNIIRRFHLISLYMKIICNGYQSSTVNN